MPVIEITSLTHPGVDVFSTLTEAQLRNRLDPQRGIFIAESPKVIRVALEAGYEPVSLLCERKHLTGDAEDLVRRMADLPVYTGDRDLLARLTGCTVSEVKEHFIGMTEHLSRKLHTNILAKDCVSLLAGESGSCMNTSGSASLAKAGSGDVLTGVIAGCTAILKDIYLGAAAGAFLHGRAGTLAGLAKGPHSTLARDIAEEIGRAMEES